jgi:hypothetical protein
VVASHALQANQAETWQSTLLGIVLGVGAVVGARVVVVVESVAHGVCSITAGHTMPPLNGFTRICLWRLRTLNTMPM